MTTPPIFCSCSLLQIYIFGGSHFVGGEYFSLVSCGMSHALCKLLIAIVDRSSIMNGLGRCIFILFAFKSMSLGKEFPGAVKLDRVILWFFYE